MTSNAKKNQVLIQNSLEDPDLEEMMENIEEKRRELKKQIKELTEIIIQLESKPRDEEAIERIKSTNLEEMAKISGEISETIRSDLNMSDSFVTIYKAMNDMATTQKNLLSFIVKF